ncbi:hypothetical protein PROFUN_12354 [Planoprotostelium fungivorum]|uniref:GATA-type domain-containing protein n=1 Tax=Planoprotostelium fungivorum TaxID=1890364 RepID=A0A2P6N9G9_9EUKA|nr:hypothetical protein PROFUN_12354 [Planoprotostelium fungivorum]
MLSHGDSLIFRDTIDEPSRAPSGVHIKVETLPPLVSSLAVSGGIFTKKSLCLGVLPRPVSRHPLGFPGSRNLTPCFSVNWWIYFTERVSTNEIKTCFHKAMGGCCCDLKAPFILDTKALNMLMSQQRQVHDVPSPLFGHNPPTNQQLTNQINYIDTYWKTILEVSKGLQNMFDDAAHEFAFTGSVRPPSSSESMALFSYGSTLVDLAQNAAPSVSAFTENPTAPFRNTSTQQQQPSRDPYATQSTSAPLSLWQDNRLKSFFPPAVTNLPLPQYSASSNVIGQHQQPAFESHTSYDFTALPDVSIISPLGQTSPTQQQEHEDNPYQLTDYKEDKNAMENRFQPYLNLMTRNRRVRKGKTAKPKDEKDRNCAWCGATSTPEWRNGPEGSVLCNACGLQSASGCDHHMSAPIEEAPPATSPEDNGQPAPPPARVSVSPPLEESETNIAVEPSDLTEVWRNYADETVSSFNSAAEFAREVQGDFYAPEIVLIGERGSGKTTLLEALLGASITLPSTTIRPLFIQMINTGCLPNRKEFEEPRIVVKRDAHYQKLFPTDVTINLSQLPSEIANRSKGEIISTPVRVTIHWNHCTNINIIDTPGLADWQTQDERSRIVNDLSKESNRILIFVESAKAWAEVKCLDSAHRLDSVGSRSFFVFTHFWEYLKRDLVDQSSVNNYLTKKPQADMKAFFVSLLSEEVKKETMEDHTFQQRLIQCHKRDMKYLEKLKFDRAEEDWIGLYQLRTELLKSNYSFYKDSLVTFRKSLAGRKKEIDATINALEDQRSLDLTKIRWLMSTYVSEWVQIMVHFVDGSHEGGTSLYGQTVVEENSAENSSPWKHRDQVIDLDRGELMGHVEPGMDRMSGGDQFNRLLEFFRRIVNLPEVSNVSDDDIIAAMGNLNDHGNFSDSLETSTKIVQMHLEVLDPLISQLVDRAMYVVKRLADISFDVISNQSKKMESSSRKLYGFSLINGFSQFQGNLRDIFYEYVDEIGKNFRGKCRDEMAGTRVLVHRFQSIPVEGEKFHLIQSLCAQLMHETKQYLLRNILLKAHRLFVSQFQQNVNSEIMKNVAQFSDSLLDEMFDLKATRENVNKRLQKQERDAMHLEERENELRDLISRFGRLKMVPNAKLSVLQSFSDGGVNRTVGGSQQQEHALS